MPNPPPIQLHVEERKGKARVGLLLHSGQTGTYRMELTENLVLLWRSRVDIYL